MVGYKNQTTTQQDTGWGVIYRLNNLFGKVEELAPKGDYDNWNLMLDRIWSNLTYKNPLNIEKSKDGKITSIDYDDSDIDEKDFIDNQILAAKKEMNIEGKKTSEDNSKKTKEFIIAKKKLYRQLLLKEIWLRKKMQLLGLYLKEVEYNPAGAMWNK